MIKDKKLISRIGRFDNSVRDVQRLVKNEMITDKMSAISKTNPFNVYMSTLKLAYKSHQD